MIERYLKGREERKRGGLGTHDIIADRRLSGGRQPAEESGKGSREREGQVRRRHVDT